jgi:uncharacterized protein (TIGR03000 family)
MKKTVVILSLTAFLALTFVCDVSAQVRVGIGVGGVNIGVGYYGGPYYHGNPWYPYYSGYRYPSEYYGPSYYYGPGFYAATPDYYYPTPSYSAAPNNGNASAPSINETTPMPMPITKVSTSFYYDPNSASITINVPNPDAEIWFDGTRTKQRGFERHFHTPPLPAGTSTYTIRASWDDGINNVDRTRQIQVYPGQSVTVDFRQR